MKSYQWFLFISLFALNLTLTGCQKSEEVVFSCEKDSNSDYVTKIRYQDKMRDLIVWKRTDFVNKGFPPQRRCQEVTPQLQKAYNNGTLKTLTWDYVQDKNNPNKKYKSLCTSTDKQCHTLILTLLESDDPDVNLKQFIAIFHGDGSKATVSYLPCKIPQERSSNLTCNVNVSKLFDDN